MPAPPRAPVVLVALALAFAPAVATAGPAEPLLRLVPPDTTLCFVLQDLRTHVNNLAGSPFADWLSNSPVGRRFGGGADADRVRAAATFFQTMLGVSAPDLLDEVFGDAVVFAYQAGPPGKPADEAGLILIKPRKPEVLARLVGKLNDLQKAGGELKAVREGTHRGQSYTVREKAAGGPEYHTTRDGVFAFTGQEGVIRAFLDRNASPAEPSPVLAGFRRLGVQDKAAVLWLNPRGVEPELRAKAAATADPNERAFLHQFLKLWAATDGLAAAVHPDRGLEVTVSAAVRREAVPPELAALLFPTPGGSAVWPAVPADAMLAVGGRAAVPKLFEAVGSFLPGDGKKALRAVLDDGLGPVFGKDKLPAVAKGVGPDWAAWVAPPGPDAGWFPRGVAAVRLAEGDATRAVTRALDLGFQLAQVAHNQSHPDQIDSREERQGDVIVRSLANDAGFPPGLRPCYAVKGGYLILATTPAAVAEFTPPAGMSEGANPPLARCSVRQVREYLTRYRELIANAATTGQQKPPADVADGLGKLAGVLEAFDRADLRYETSDGRVALTLRIELAKPLK